MKAIIHSLVLPLVGIVTIILGANSPAFAATSSGISSYGTNTPQPNNNTVTHKNCKSIEIHLNGKNNYTTQCNMVNQPSNGISTDTTSNPAEYGCNSHDVALYLDAQYGGAVNGLLSLDTSPPFSGLPQFC